MHDHGHQYAFNVTLPYKMLPSSDGRLLPLCVVSGIKEKKTKDKEYDAMSFTILNIL